MQGVSAARGEPRRLGHLGWREHLEPALRGFVAGWLGLTPDRLRADVSFADDLAMSPRDVTELAVEAERDVRVHLPGAAVDQIRTFGDLVDRVVEARVTEAPDGPPRVLVRAALGPARRDGRPTLLRTVWLSPYAVDTLVADARRAGPGACLDVTVPAAAPLAVAERVERCLASLAGLGVTVRVQHARLPRGRAVA